MERNFVKEYEEHKKQCTQMVTEILADELKFVNEKSRKSILSRTVNGFMGHHLYSRSDIINADDWFLCMHFKGRYAQIVINTVKENIDIKKEREKRLAEIDRTINRLLEEKENLLKIMG